MNAAVLSTIGAVSGALAMVVVYLLSKRHKEHIEDQEQETNHVTAISAASETLAAAVNVLIEPLNQSIIQLQAREREMAIEMTQVKAELAVVKADHRRLNRDLESLIAYIRALWTQIKATGAKPLPPPADVLHVVWEDMDDPDPGA